jgi:hypothetical protein
MPAFDQRLKETMPLPTLIIHTPSWRTDEDGARSYEQVMSDKVGVGYAIPQAKRELLTPGCKVVLLCKDKAKRAEGTLRKLEPVGKTLSGMQRYDVQIDGLREVPYRSENLGRTGVAVLTDE